MAYKYSFLILSDDVKGPSFLSNNKYNSAEFAQQIAEDMLDSGDYPGCRVVLIEDRTEDTIAIMTERGESVEWLVRDLKPRP